MKNIWDRIFNRWTKWTIYKSDVPYVLTRFSVAWGQDIGSPQTVIADIYEKTNKFNGLKKYKRVIKYR